METRSLSGVKNRWFSVGRSSTAGCVTEAGDECRVFVGGTLIGVFDRSDRDLGPRNAALVALLQDSRVHRGQMAEAFGLTYEQLRRIGNQAEQEGIAAVVIAKRGGSERKAPAAVRKRLWKAFADGMKAREAHERIGRRAGLSISTVKRERWAWEKENASKDKSKAVVEPDPEPATASHRTLFDVSTSSEGLAAEEAASPEAVRRVFEDDVGSATETRVAVMSAEGRSSFDEGQDTAEEIRVQHGTTVRGGAQVQHVGSWLMSGMAERMGLFDGAQSAGEAWSGAPRGDALRIALDAALTALTIGERSVEGVRRLGTPTAPLLLRCRHAPSASWTRRILHAFADRPAVVGLFQLDVMGRLIGDAQRDDLAVFYVDNHLRPYTGKHVLRRGFRMQDKRVRPGATDYYVHDVDGRPILSFVSPDHEPLTKWLVPAGQRLRDALGAEQRILLAFDRAGAYPRQMAELRDADFEFVTYERRPFPLLSPSAFDRTVKVDGIEIGLHESSERNLGGGRGRVRRIALRTENGSQVNLVACSREPAERLVGVMIGDDEEHGRWVQENAFKHGAERWGINQLDGRRVAAYDPSTIVPNPARRRLDRALRLEYVREGLILRELEQLDDGPRRDRLREDLTRSREEQRKLLALRPSMPKKAPLERTELADVLVHHRSEYKAVLDTVRILAANIETDLAGELAPHLAKPDEAKKLLANVFKAPGRITVTRDTIHVALVPAASRREARAIAELLRRVNGHRLNLPGDDSRRPLVFKLHT